MKKMIMVNLKIALQHLIKFL